jgi:hypothetical protein
MANDTPVACSLSGDELARRLDTIAEVGAANLISSGSDGSRRLLHFQKTETVRRRLEEIVASESECCSFLDLSLEEQGDGLVLSIAAPENARAIADELAEAFTRAAP